MKTLVKTGLFTLALPVSLFCGSHAAAATYEVNDWYAISSNASANIANGDTSSPTVYTGNGSSVNLISYFTPSSSPLILNDGQKITVDFNVSLNLGEGAASKSAGLRLGLLSASEPRASVAGYGADRTTSTAAAGGTITDWKGLLLDKGSAASELRIFRKTGGSVLSTSSAGTDGVSNRYFSGSSGLNVTFVDDTIRSFTWELVRSGNDLITTLASDGQSFSYTLTDAFVAYGTDPYAFNAFDGMTFSLLNSDGVAISSVNLSNIAVSLGQIPEPSSVMLVIGGAAAGVVFFARRRRGSRS